MYDDRLVFESLDDLVEMLKVFGWDDFADGIDRDHGAHGISDAYDDLFDAYDVVCPREKPCAILPKELVDRLTAFTQNGLYNHGPFSEAENARLFSMFFDGYATTGCARPRPARIVKRQPLDADTVRTDQWLSIVTEARILHEMLAAFRGTIRPTHS